MHLSTKLLILSVILAMIGYYVFLGIQYLRGQFQYTLFFPGRYIFPRWIKDEIRLNILMLFKSYKIYNLHQLEQELDHHLAENKINTVDNSMSSKEFYRYRIGLGENSFKYFLYLYKSAVITGIIKATPLTQSNIALSKQYIRKLNTLVFTKHSKQIVSNNDRSVILAEILRRALDILNPSRLALPYNCHFYDVISRDDIIKKHESLIVKAINDDEVISLINTFYLDSNPIYIKNGQMQNLMFISRVCLLTNWLKQ